MVMTPDPELADVLIVNTCSFIDSAKRESIDAIHEMSDRRAERGVGGQQRIVVAGCLAQRFARELPALMPEVDAFIGLDQITGVVPVVEELVAANGGRPTEGRNRVSKRPVYIPDAATPRYRLTPDHYAYIKIAEGCNHPCTFCIIPQVRGRHRSRSVVSVVEEARQLVSQGVRELNLISQDTTYFGMDLWEDDRPHPRSRVDSSKGESLASLLLELNAVEGDFWIRLLYTHPAHWSDELIETIAACPKVARYIDMPIQHIAEPILAAMQRETTGAYIRDLIRRMRAGIPGLALRTTFIVGFPGETEQDFEELLDFMEEARFERAGIFEYSREEGTRAYRLGEQVHPMTRKQRWRQSMLLLEESAREINQAQVGRRMKVLVEAPGVARTEWDAPEIDASVFVDKQLAVGEFAEVTIGEWRGYDLVAER